MRLFEIECPKLFLCVPTAHQIGATVTSHMGVPNPLDPAIEERLEARRPEGCFSRRTAVPVFASPSDHPTGADFVYRVQASDWGRYHTGWLKLMTEIDPAQTGTLDSYAIRYWKGIECPEAPREPWEYRADSVRIMGRLGGSSAGWETLDRISPDHRSGL